MDPVETMEAPEEEIQTEPVENQPETVDELPVDDVPEEPVVEPQREAPPEMQQLLDIAKRQQDYINQLEARNAPKPEKVTIEDRLKARGVTDPDTLKLLSVAAEEMRDMVRQEVIGELGPVVHQTATSQRDRALMDGMANEYGLSKQDQAEIARIVAERRQSGSRADAEELHFAALGQLRAKNNGSTRLADARQAKLNSQKQTREPNNRQTTLVPQKVTDEEYEDMTWEEKVAYFHKSAPAK